MSFERLRVKADGAAEFLTLIGNAKRLAILSYLVEGEMAVSAIARRVALSQSALSQHLAKLRMAGLVETRRERQMIFYSCRSRAVRQLLQALDGIFDDAALLPDLAALDLHAVESKTAEPHHL